MKGESELMVSRYLKMATAIVCATLITSACATTSFAAQAGRERLLMDFNWKFKLGAVNDVDGSGLVKAGSAENYAVKGKDDDWRSVNLPHDWCVEQPLDPKADGGHGYFTLGYGYPDTSVGWYSKRFDIPKSDLGRRISIEFDGVFRDSQIWFNGHYLGRQESGYSPFKYDITDYIDYGKQNRLVVRVDASQFEGWFYEGAGIYRHTWLVKTAPVHIPQWGTFVSTDVKGKSANGKAIITVANDSRENVRFTVYSTVFDANGTVIAETKPRTKNVDARSEFEVEQPFKIANPNLWSPETPYLYSVVSTIKVGNEEVDKYTTTFGIRTVAWDPDKGFLLNGKPYVMKGTCNHQDHAGVGVALPDRVNEFRIERLKDMGCNAYRTSHNPPTPELLDACDRLGMMVMDENRLMGSSPEVLSQVERLVKRDRNHPSVVVWSIANEEHSFQYTEPSTRVAQTMIDLFHKLDPTRKCTYAANTGAFFDGVNSVIDVRGWNYNFRNNVDEYRKKRPNQPQVGTEQASTLCTRGEYANDTTQCFMSAYDDNAPSWGHLAEDWVKYFGARQFLSGAYVWTGFDYRGEPTPYPWPAVSSQFGIMDTCGFAKDNFYYYQSWWSDKNVLHILPHWNWPGKEGQEIDVRCLSNCDEVELFLNGQSQGKKHIDQYCDARWKVKYAPGELSAIGYRDGKEVMKSKVETTGAPAGVQLKPDCIEINADGEDVSIITVAVVDSEGRTVPTANNEIAFDISGNAKIIGVGNGNPSSHEPDKFTSGWKRKAFNGLCQILVQSTKTNGSFTLTAKSAGLADGEVKVFVKPCTPRPAVP